MKTAIIGTGMQGSRYASMIASGKVSGMELAAVTRFRDQYKALLQPALEKGIPVFQSADELFEAFDQGRLNADAVIITTPHPSHETIACQAFSRGLHVLCDKPAGVYSSEARRMDEAAKDSGCVYGMIFNQRALAVNQKIHEIIHSGRYGALKRLIWTVTDWYRPEKYYQSGSWRATWKGEGGGVLLNQCPHNLDLLTWFCGMPSSVTAFCKEGHYHNIEVEDDATIYMEWANGASGTFITSTGDAPGINRLEIFLEEALIKAENGRLEVFELEPELGMKEQEYRKSAEDCFRKIHGERKEIGLSPGSNPYITVFESFANAVDGSGRLIAEGSEGRNSLMISNAAYLSSWKHCTIKIPEPGTTEEEQFEKVFEMYMAEKQNRNRKD